MRFQKSYVKRVMFVQKFGFAKYDDKIKWGAKNESVRMDCGNIKKENMPLFDETDSVEFGNTNITHPETSCVIHSKKFKKNKKKQRKTKEETKNKKIEKIFLEEFKNIMKSEKIEINEKKELKIDLSYPGSTNFVGSNFLKLKKDII